jgi:hypothetical protein
MAPFRKSQPLSSVSSLSRSPSLLGYSHLLSKLNIELSRTQKPQLYTR